MVPVIRSASLTDYTSLARSLGLEPFAMAEAAGIDRHAFSDPELLISFAALVRLIESSAVAARRDDFAVMLAANRRLSNLGPVALLLKEEPTVRSAMGSLQRYLCLHTNGLDLQIEEIGAQATLSPVITVESLTGTRQAVDLAMSILYGILVSFLGPDWHPRICFTHSEPENVQSFRDFFRGRLEFGASLNGIVLLARDFDRRLAHGDPLLAQYARQYVEGLVLRAGPDLPDRVRQLVRHLLPKGSCSLAAVGRQLGISARTLNRRLHTNGTTFSEIVEQVRKEQVLVYLQNPRWPLGRVGEALGFSMQSAFSRWFREHFQQTASSWRDENASKPSRVHPEHAGVPK